MEEINLYGVGEYKTEWCWWVRLSHAFWDPICVVGDSVHGPETEENIQCLVLDNEKAYVVAKSQYFRSTNNSFVGTAA